MTERANDHFLRSVTQLGDRQQVTNHRDITSDTGLKLVAAGNHITSKLYDKLVRHKLLPPLEQCLSIENGVDHASLIAQIEQMVTRADSPFAPVRDELPLPWCRGVIQQLPLPPAIGFKLTVAREERPELYEHSLMLAALTLYLCRRIGWDEPDTVCAVSAALLHDIGILHIDHHLFESGHTMTLEERRSLYAHPLISHMILQAFPEYPPEVGDGVLQHHERLDGTGYPRGLAGNEIGRIGQLLGVAELIGSRFRIGEGCRDCAQLDLILKLNSQRLNAEYTLHLKPFYREGGLHSANSYSLERCRIQVSALSMLFTDWQSLAAIHQPVDREEAEQVALLDREVKKLKKNLLQTGLVFSGHPPQEAPGWLSDDPEHLAEVTFLLKEAGWQLSDLYHLLYRRWPRLNPSGALHNWIERLPRLLAR